LQLLTWNRRLTGWQIDPWPTSRAEFQRPRVQPPAPPGPLCCLEVSSASATFTSERRASGYGTSPSRSPARREHPPRSLAVGKPALWKWN